MVKQFHLKVSKNPSSSLNINDTPSTPLPDIALGDLTPIIEPFDDSFRYLHKYPIIPTYKPQNVLKNVYTQHRQQDRGRAIALKLDPRYKLIKRIDNIWTWQIYEEGHTEDTLKTYSFEWDEIGESPLNINFENTYTNISGYPHAFAWAAWFIINGIPDNNNWPPIPSVNPNWHFDNIPDWVEYPASSLIR